VVVDAPVCTGLCSVVYLKAIMKMTKWPYAIDEKHGAGEKESLRVSPWST
jgi:hypothetical protein